MVVPLSPDPLRMAIVAAARGWIGTPYRHQAARRGIGCDCLGLVAGVWAEIYGAMPDYDRSYSADWAESAGAGEPLLDACKTHCDTVSIGDEQPGDLLVFRWSAHVAAKHLAILSAPAMMIHARERHAVCETALTGWWTRRLVAVFAFPHHSGFSAAR